MEWIVSIELTSWGLIIMTLISAALVIIKVILNNRHRSSQLDKILKHKDSVHIEEGSKNDSFRINKLK